MIKSFGYLLSFLILLLGPTTSSAQSVSKKISISTGGTGGVYYPLGGAIAAIVSKNLPGVEATAEVTGGSVDNIKLLNVQKSDVGFTMADAAADGFKGEKPFTEKQKIRALAVLYPNRMQIVTVEGKGIEKLADLKGKRISTGSPGSGGELMSKRLFEAEGYDFDKDFKRERLSVSEAVNALKDGKIDAFTWVGGVPTAAITDLAATPGLKIKFINHGDAAAKMVKFGPYIKGVIPAKSYPNQDKDVSNVDVWNILAVNENTDEKLVYEITKLLFEKKADLVAAHKDAEGLALENQLKEGAAAIPFHPGALRYFKEKGLAVK